METLHPGPITDETQTQRVGDGATAVPVDLGGRLDAGRAADLQWRESRTEAVVDELRKLHHQGALARWSTVVAGLLTVPIWILTGPAAQAPLALGPWRVRFILGWITLALLGLGPILAQLASRRQRELLRRAERDAIELPPAVHLEFPAARTFPAELDVRGLKTSELQYQADRAEVWSRTARGACLCAGYAAWIAYPLLLLRQLQLDPSGALPVTIDFYLMCSLLPIVISPIPALAALWNRHRSRRALRKAVAEGLDVRDPAGSPWD